MSKEAMTLALEALEVEAIACRYEKYPTPEHIAKAITALQEALAEQPAQQEPVATVIGKFLTRKDELRTCIEPELPLGTKLYTSPPAQRTWVGLTDDEKAELDAEYGDDTLAHLDAIERKLKEKNT